MTKEEPRSSRRTKRGRRRRRLQQLRPPGHARRADMNPRGEPRARRRARAAAKRLGTRRGFVAVKPNCSLQSYVPAIHPLMKFGPKRNRGLHVPGDLGGGEDLRVLAGDDRQPSSRLSGRGGEDEQEPMRSGLRRRRPESRRRRTRDHGPVHPRARHRRAHGRPRSSLDRKPDMGRGDRALEELGAEAAEDGAAVGAEAVPHLLRGR